MKQFKFAKFFGLTVALLLVATCITFAQTSTAVSDSTTVAVTDSIFSVLETKYPIVTIIGTVLFFISEALSFFPKIEANGVFQLVAKILSYFKKK